MIGGTRGIGAAISRALSKSGASVAMIYLNRSEDAEKFAIRLQSDGGWAKAFRADIADPQALNEAIEAVFESCGRVDILVNVAGIAMLGPLEDHADDAFDRIFSINVRAPYLAIKKVLTRMTAGGRIITIGSIVADRMPGEGGTLYAASKSALGGLTRGLARDLGSKEITVNLIQPGPIDTERNPASGPNADANRAPLAIKRHGTAEEVASLAEYLASPAASFITGATYNIDGGWSA